MSRETIIGDYGKLAKASTSVISTGTLVEGAKYVVKTVGGTSALPNGAAVGYCFVADGTEDITSSGDEVILLTEVDQCDIQAWSLDFSKAEIDATTLCDKNNVYLGGKTDVTGSIDGIFKIGITDVDDGFANGFIDIVKQDGEGGDVTINEINGDQIVVILYLQKDKSAGETETFYVAPVTLTSFSSGIATGSTSAFSSSMRIAPEEDVKFQLVGVTRS